MSLIPIVSPADAARIEALFRVHSGSLTLNAARREQYPYLSGAAAALGRRMPPRWQNAIRTMTLVTSLPPLDPMLDWEERSSFPG